MLLLHEDVEVGHGTIYTVFYGEVVTRNFLKTTLEMVSSNVACSLDEYVVNIAAIYIRLLSPFKHFFLHAAHKEVDHLKENPWLHYQFDDICFLEGK